MRKFCLVALLAAAGFAHADSCDALLGKYVDQDKELASVRTWGVVDNSTLRETSRLLQANNALLRKQMLLQTMSLQKCPLPKVFENSFLMSALTCVSEMKRDSTSDSSKATCDRSKWRPDDAGPQ